MHRPVWGSVSCDCSRYARSFETGAESHPSEPGRSYRLPRLVNRCAVRHLNCEACALRDAILLDENLQTNIPWKVIVSDERPEGLR